MYRVAAAEENTLETQKDQEDVLAWVGPCALAKTLRQWGVCQPGFPFNIRSSAALWGPSTELSALATVASSTVLYRTIAVFIPTKVDAEGVTIVLGL